MDYLTLVIQKLIDYLDKFLLEIHVQFTKSLMNFLFVNWPFFLFFSEFIYAHSFNGLRNSLSQKGIFSIAHELIQKLLLLLIDLVHSEC